MKGSKRGLVTDGLDTAAGSLYVVEGFSDCLALLAAGLNAIARPSKSIKPATVAAMICEFLSRYAIGPDGAHAVVIVADADDAVETGNAAQIAALLTRELPDAEIRAGRLTIFQGRAKDILALGSRTGRKLTLGCSG